METTPRNYIKEFVDSMNMVVSKRYISDGNLIPPINIRVSINPIIGATIDSRDEIISLERATLIQNNIIESWQMNYVAEELAYGLTATLRYEIQKQIQEQLNAK